MSLDSLIVQWETDDTVESLENYSYNIYRCAETDNDAEYTFIANIPGNVFEFKDDTAMQYKRKVCFYYKIVPINKNTLEEGLFVKCLSLYDRKKDNYANYMRYLNNVYLNVIGNHKGYVLVRKKFGQKCSRCWDDIRRQHKQHNCPNCFGTGYEGGYHNPSDISFSYMSMPFGNFENVGIDGRGDNVQDVSIWTGNHPIISVGDIFVDENNNRFKITQVQRTIKNNEFILRQILNMQLLSTSDPVYNVIIDIRGDEGE